MCLLIGRVKKLAQENRFWLGHYSALETTSWHQWYFLMVSNEIWLEMADISSRGLEAQNPESFSMHCYSLRSMYELILEILPVKSRPVSIGMCIYNRL